MLLNLFEVYKETVHHNKAEAQVVFQMREVIINDRFITFMRDDSSMINHLREGRLPSSLPKNQKFTRISMSQGNVGQDIVVVGDLNHITELLNPRTDNKRTLKG